MKFSELAEYEIFSKKTKMNIGDELVLLTATYEEYDGFIAILKKKGSESKEDMFRVLEFSERIGNGYSFKTALFDREDYECDCLFNEYCMRIFLGFLRAKSDKPIKVLRPENLNEHETFEFNLSHFERSEYW